MCDLSHGCTNIAYVTRGISFFFLSGTVIWHVLSGLITRYIGYAFDAALVDELRSTLFNVSIVMLGMVLTRGVVGIIASTSIELISHRLVRDVRNELYISLLKKNQTFHDRQRVGELMARTTNDTEQLGLMVSPGIDLTFDSILSIVIPLIFIATLEPELLMTPAIFVVVFVFLLIGYSRKLERVTMKMREQFGALNGDVTEKISGIDLVKAAAQERQSIRKFKILTGKYRDLFVEEGTIRARYLPPLVLGIAVVVSFLHGLYVYTQQQISIGDFAAYMGLIGMLRVPVALSGFSFGMIFVGTASAKRVLTCIEAKADPPIVRSAYKSRVMGDVLFENVTFGYQGVAAIQDVSFRIRPGQTVVVVGQTGSGKSSLIKLINRLYDPDEGRILIDGVDIREWDIDSIRSQTATIEQDTFLFSNSITENIAFGCKEPPPFSVIEQSAREAQAHSFITNFKNSYDTIIGERGVMLSGGQRQRIAIARALLKDPRILILDDATSAIDSATENEIQLAIGHILANRTAILISHRLSLVRRADLILVMRRGRLLDQGTHEELMVRCDMYRRLFTVSDISTLSKPTG